MVLGFSQNWPEKMPAHMAGKETLFVDKIWLCLNWDNDFAMKRDVFDWEKYFNEYYRKFKNTDPFGYHDEKLTKKRHTIRRDEINRWKAGTDIHFVIGNRTKKRFQFAPVVKCVSVQKIEIKHFASHIEIEIDGIPYFVDKNSQGRIYMYCGTIETLAKNDGFDSVHDFFSWFNEDYTGKIIHWTDLRYIS